MEAAVWAFAELGFENATLSVIAQRAGVTAATLPYHFRDKQGLWDAVIAEFYKGLLEFGRELIADAGPAQLPAADEIRAALVRVYDWSEENRNGIRVIIRNVIETGSLDRQVREERMGLALALVSKAVSTRYAIDERRARDAAISVTHLVTRFVTNSPDDNCLAFAVATHEEARARIIDVLVRVSHTLLGLPGSP